MEENNQSQPKPSDIEKIFSLMKKYEISDFTSGKITIKRESLKLRIENNSQEHRVKQALGQAGK